MRSSVTRNDTTHVHKKLKVCIIIVIIHFPKNAVKCDRWSDVEHHRSSATVRPASGDPHCSAELEISRLFLLQDQTLSSVFPLSAS